MSEFISDYFPEESSFDLPAAPQPGLVAYAEEIFSRIRGRGYSCEDARWQNDETGETLRFIKNTSKKLLLL